MSRHIKNINILSSIAMKIVFAYTFFIFVQHAANDENTNPYVNLLIPLFIMMAYIIRRLIYNLVLYAGVHIAVIVSIFVIPFNIIDKFLYLILLATITWDSIYYWKHNNEPIYSELPWPNFLILIGIYLYSYMGVSSLTTNTVFFLSIVYLFFHFIRMYTYHLENFIKSNKDVTSFPIKRVLLSNSAMVLIVIVIIFTTITIGKILDLDKYIYVLGNGFVMLFKYLSNALMAFFAYLGSLFSSVSSDTVTTTEESLRVVAPDTTSLFYILSEMFTLAIKLIMLVGSIYITCKGVYKLLRKYLNRHVKNDDIIIISSEASNKEKDNTPSFKTKLETFFDRSNSGKVRKIYKKQVLTYKEAISLTPSNTTGEINTNINKETSKNISKLTATYNQARYSNENILDHQVKEATNK